MTDRHGSPKAPNGAIGTSYTRREKWRMLGWATMLWAVLLSIMVLVKLAGFHTAADWIGYAVTIIANGLPIMLIDVWLTKKPPADEQEKTPGV